jgi:hypothetical protein
MNEEIRILEAQIRECFGRVIYSHKTHEKCADIYLFRLASIKNLQIILATLTTGTILSDIFSLFGLGIWAKVLSAVFSITLLVLNAYSKNFNLGELAQKHRDTAIRLWEVREKYLSLITDIKAGLLDAEATQAKRDILQAELEVIYSSSPATFNRAYKKAQKALQISEDFTFNDGEINKFLPDVLRS